MNNDDFDSVLSLDELKSKFMEESKELQKSSDNIETSEHKDNTSGDYKDIVRNISSQTDTYSQIFNESIKENKSSRKSDIIEVLRPDDDLTQVGVKKTKKGKVSRIISDIIFYTAIVAMICVAIAFNQSNSPNKALLGYRFFNVLTDSMQSEIPAGSLVFTKVMDKNEIQVGDDISFYYNQDTIVTHQVVEIIDDYNKSGERGFVTKGVDNAIKDENPVSAANVIGVVKFHIPMAGFWLNHIADHVLLVGLAFILVVVLSFCIRFIFADRKLTKINKITGREEVVERKPEKPKKTKKKKKEEFQF